MVEESTPQIRLLNAIDRLSNRLDNYSNTLKEHNTHQLQTLKVMSDMAGYKITGPLGRVVHRSSAGLKKITSSQDTTLKGSIHSLSSEITDLNRNFKGNKKNMDDINLSIRELRDINKQQSSFISRITSTFTKTSSLMIKGIGKTMGVASSAVNSQMSQFKQTEGARAYEEAKESFKKAMMFGLGGGIVPSSVLGIATGVTKDIANILRGRGSSGGEIEGVNSFARGGIVPGPKGMPKNVTVHGGELVIPADYKDALLGRLDTLIKLQMMTAKHIEEGTNKELLQIFDVLNYGNSITRLFSEPMIEALHDIRKGIKDVRFSIKGLLFDLPKFLIKDIVGKVLLKDLFWEMAVKNIVGKVFIRSILWEELLQPFFISFFTDPKQRSTLIKSGLGAVLGSFFGPYGAIAGGVAGAGAGMSFPLAGGAVGAGIGNVIGGPMGGLTGAGIGAIGGKLVADLFKNANDLEFEQLLELQKIEEHTRNTVFALGGKTTDYGNTKTAFVYKYTQAIGEYNKLLQSAINVGGWLGNDMKELFGFSKKSSTNVSPSKTSLTGYLDQSLRVLMEIRDTLFGQTGIASESLKIDRNILKENKEQSRSMIMMMLSRLASIPGSMLSGIGSMGMGALAALGLGGVAGGVGGAVGKAASGVGGFGAKMLSKMGIGGAIGGAGIMASISPILAKLGLGKMSMASILKFMKNIKIPGVSALITLGWSLMNGDPAALAGSKAVGAGIGMMLGGLVGAPLGPIPAFIGGAIGSYLGEAAGEKLAGYFGLDPKYSGTIVDAKPGRAQPTTQQMQNAIVPMNFGTSSSSGNRVGVYSQFKPQDSDPFPTPLESKVSGMVSAGKNTIIDYAVKMIKSHEGFSPIAYRDKGRISIGYGTLANGRTTITEAEATKELREYVLNSYNKAKTQFRDFDMFPDHRKAAILDMMYNLGNNFRNKFRTASQYMDEGKWDLAGQAMLTNAYGDVSKYVRDTGNRAYNMAELLYNDPMGTVNKAVNSAYSGSADMMGIDPMTADYLKRKGINTVKDTGSKVYNDWSFKDPMFIDYLIDKGTKAYNTLDWLYKDPMARDYALRTGANYIESTENVTKEKLAELQANTNYENISKLMEDQKNNMMEFGKTMVDSSKEYSQSALNVIQQVPVTVSQYLGYNNTVNGGVSKDDYSDIKSYLDGETLNILQGVSE